MKAENVTMTQRSDIRFNSRIKRAILAFSALGISCLLCGLWLLAGNMTVVAQESVPESTATPSDNAGSSSDNDLTFHPAFALLDSEQVSVLISGQPVSTMNTCGQCHDTVFITRHNAHPDVGMSGVTTSDNTANGRATAQRSSLFAGWDPLTYRDLTSEEAVQPGAVEMNCFLCHAASPDNASRIAELDDDDFSWANTATLAETGIVEQRADGWRWNPDAFNADGTVKENLIQIGDPANGNCGQCHGVVHDDNQTPLTLAVGDGSQWNTLTTGQVFSPQRLSNSGLNLQDKGDLSRSWDIHAERVVSCTDCHYALNNPVFYTESDASRPDHLSFDPRRMDFGEYLYRPLHQFANSDMQTDTASSSTGGACSTCHNATNTHNWLPYADRHIDALACETCHVPTLYAPALEMLDWTSLQADGTPLTGYRGLQTHEDGELLVGFQPALLPELDGDAEDTQLTPYNLLTAWYWVSGDPARPVPLDALKSAWFDGDNSYNPEIQATFDANADGRLNEVELRLDSDAKVALIASRLEALGMTAPRIVGEVLPYAIHHNVTQGEWAVRECDTCHSGDSRLSTPVTLAGYVPGGVMPMLPSGNTTPEISFITDSDGTLNLQLDINAAPTALYVLGHDSVALVDLLGTLTFIGVCIGAMGHGGLRYLSARRFVAHQPASHRRVYMYSIYERQWHWLQTAAIFGLILTGLVIHRPDTFAMFNFGAVVLAHNALAVVLVINAALAAFYHLVSGEIRQFLPRPYGFFDQAFAQAKYYLYGIFRGEPHPYEKTRDRKMNPLQQITYLMILNVLLPLQIITGALMWGAQHFPDITASLGGLGFLAPFHTLIAWLFASFIVMHVYLTTTGTTMTSNIKAMITGWEEVEGSQTDDVAADRGSPVEEQAPAFAADDASDDVL